MNKGKRLIINYVLFFLLVALVCSRIFILIAKGVTSNEVIDFDHRIIAIIQSYVTESFTTIMIVISFFGSIKGITFFIVLLTGILCWRKKWALAIFLVGTSGIGALLNKGLKWYFKRERPDILPLVVEQSYSFPSGHSMGSLLFYGSLAYIIIHLVKTTNMKLAAVLILAFIILCIGISRIYLGVHYPTDVLGGFSIGIAFLFLCIICFRYYEERSNR
ncbi:phosphatase PAP2 family protein [Niallia sp. 01092]|uniref:phosphatase PAP2 family protein n=1 Tax=unclassified Niallia TaxID=2837522 RepID=UPI003FD260DD